MIRPLSTKIKFTLQGLGNSLYTSAVSKLVSSLPESRIAITNNFGYSDGAGAQVQRILSLIAFARKHKLEFNLTPIRSVEVQPIDYISDEVTLEDNIQELNWWLVNNFNITEVSAESKIFRLNRRIDLLRLLLLLNFRCLVGINFEKHSIGILDSYFETLNSPETWNLLTSGYADDSSSEPSRQVHMHVRLSTFSQSSDRKVTFDYYRKALDEIKLRANAEGWDFNLIVHTDFHGNVTPRDFFLANAVPQSLSYWIQLDLISSSLDVNQDLIADAREALKVFLSQYPSAEIFESQSWISEWEAMSSADYLIATKSSFSLVAGVLNPKGTIFVPSTWNLKLPRWVPIY